MSIEPIIKYPFDSTAESPTNYFQNESHVIEPDGQKTIVVRAGPFYSDKLIVHTPSSIEPLVRGDDYHVKYLFEDATLKTGKEVHIAISMVDPNWHGELLISGQVVGGDYSHLYPTVVDIVNEIRKNYETVSYHDLEDLPTAFPPVSHPHDVNDLTNMDELIAAIKENSQSLAGTLLFNQRPLERIVAQAVSRTDRLQRQPFEGSTYVGRHTGPLTFIMPGTQTHNSNFVARIQVQNHESFEVLTVSGQENIELIEKVKVHGDSDYDVDIYRDKNMRICVSMGDDATEWIDATVAIDSIMWSVDDPVYREVPLRWSHLSIDTLKTREPTHMEKILVVGAQTKNKMYGYSDGILPNFPVVAQVMSLDEPTEEETRLREIEAGLSLLEPASFGTLTRPEIEGAAIRQWVSLTDDSGTNTILRVATIPEGMIDDMDNSMRWVLRVNDLDGYVYSEPGTILSDGSVAWRFAGSELADWHYWEFGRAIQERLELAKVPMHALDSITKPEELDPYIHNVVPTWGTIWDTDYGTTYSTTEYEKENTAWLTHSGPEATTQRSTNWSTSLLTSKTTTIAGDGDYQTLWTTTKSTSTTYNTGYNTNTSRSTSKSTSTTWSTGTGKTTNRNTSKSTTTAWTTSYSTTKSRNTNAGTQTNWTTSKSTTKSHTTTVSTGGTKTTSKSTTTSYGTNYGTNFNTSYSTSKSTTTVFGTSKSTTTTYNTGYGSNYTTSYNTSRSTSTGWTTSHATTKSTTTSYQASRNTTYSKSTTKVASRSTSTSYNTSWSTSHSTSIGTSKTTTTTWSTSHSKSTTKSTTKPRSTSVNTTKSTSKTTSWTTSYLTVIGSAFVPLPVLLVVQLLGTTLVLLTVIPLTLRTPPIILLGMQIPIEVQLRDGQVITTRVTTLVRPLLGLPLHRGITVQLLLGMSVLVTRLLRIRQRVITLVMTQHVQLLLAGQPTTQLVVVLPSLRRIVQTLGGILVKLQVLFGTRHAQPVKLHRTLQVNLQLLVSILALQVILLGRLATVLTQVTQLANQPRQHGRLTTQVLRHEARTSLLILHGQLVTKLVLPRILVEIQLQRIQLRLVLLLLWQLVRTQTLLTKHLVRQQASVM